MAKRSLLLHYLASTLLAAGAFYAGWVARESGNERTRSEEEDPQVIRASPPKVTNPTRTPTTTADGNINSAAMVVSLSPAEVENCLRSGLTTNDPIERELLIAQALSQVTRENAAALIPLMESMDRTDENTPVLQRFLMAWGRVDGPAAVKYGRNLPKYYMGLKDEFMSPGIKGWAESDPEAALAYLDEEQLRGKYLSAFLEGAATSNQDLAFSLSAKSSSSIDAMTKALRFDADAQLAWADYFIKEGNASDSYISSALYNLSMQTTDGRALAQWIERNALDKDEFTSLHTAVGKWTKTDHLAALEWVDNSSDPRVKSAFRYAVQSWSTVDHDAAMDWTMKNLDHPDIAGVLPTVFANVAKYDPQAAADGFENLEPGLKSADTAGEIAKNWVRRKPEEALRWAQSLPDVSLQSSAIYEATRRWSWDRLDVLDAQLSAAPASEAYDQAREWLSKKVGSYSGEPLRALEIADSITDEKRRESATESAAKLLMRKNPEIVRPWVEESGLPEGAKLRILVEDPNL